MAKLADLEKQYLGRKFQNGGGYTTKEYETFQTKYINYLKSMCKEHGWEVVRVTKGHYEFSVFIKNQSEQYVYMSTTDVRDGNDMWYRHILVRLAKDDKDYRGGMNTYTSLRYLPERIERLFLMEERSGKKNA